MPPTFSVLMPCYNHAQFLPRSLEPLLAQDPPLYEIVVVDDGSTDNTRQVFAEYAARDSRVKPFYNQRNMGLGFTVDVALAQATGEYVFIVGADDFAQPGLTRTLTEMVEEHPEADVLTVGVSILEIHEDFEELRPSPVDLSDERVFLTPEALADRVRNRLTVEALGSWTFRRTVLLALGGHRADFGCYGDVVQGLVAAFRTGLWHDPQRYFHLRWQANSFTESFRRNLSRNVALLRHILRCLQTPPLDDVAPYFKRSNFFSLFAGPALLAVLPAPDLWGWIGSLSCRKTLRMLLVNLKSWLYQNAPASLQGRYRARRRARGAVTAVRAVEPSTPPSSAGDT